MGKREGLEWGVSEMTRVPNQKLGHLSMPSWHAIHHINVFKWRDGARDQKLIVLTLHGGNTRKKLTWTELVSRYFYFYFFARATCIFKSKFFHS